MNQKKRDAVTQAVIENVIERETEWFRKRLNEKLREAEDPGSTLVEGIETFGLVVQFMNPDDGTYGTTFDLFEMLTLEAQALFRQGFRLGLNGHVEAWNIAPQPGEPEQPV